MGVIQLLRNKNHTDAMSTNMPQRNLYSFYILLYCYTTLYRHLSTSSIYVDWRRRKMFSCKNQHFPSKKAMDISKTQSPDGNTIYVYKKGYSITIARQCCGMVANVVTYPGPCLVHRLYWCYTCYTIHHIVQEAATHLNKHASDAVP